MLALEQRLCYVFAVCVVSKNAWFALRRNNFTFAFTTFEL